eukprot:scaffold89649_cov25-Tisochrysis_lutea.AAC.1
MFGMRLMTPNLMLLSGPCTGMHLFTDFACVTLHCAAGYMDADGIALAPEEEFYVAPMEVRACVHACVPCLLACLLACTGWMDGKVGRWIDRSPTRA